MSSVIESKGWDKLWNLDLPHKVKIFMWRFCRNNLPFRYSLRSKGVSTPITCPMCNADVEHALHLFFDCNYANQCWEEAGLKYDMSAVEEAPQWLLDKLSTCSVETIFIIAKVLWGVWFGRNKKVWEEKLIAPNILFHLSSRQISEWQDAQKKKRTQSLKSRSTEPWPAPEWKKPEVGWCKINVDASVFEGSAFFSIGMVLRNSNGDFIAGKNFRKRGSVTVLEAEALGVQEALCWVEERRDKQVIVETDSLQVMKALNNNEVYISEVGNTLEFCRSILNHRDDLVISHVKKLGNRVAHLMARIPCLMDSCNMFLTPPQCVLETLCNDSLSKKTLQV